MFSQSLVQVVKLPNRKLTSIYVTSDVKVPIQCVHLWRR